MDILEEIKKCKTDEELKELVEEAIKVFTDIAKQENICTDYLGDNIGYNPRIITGDHDGYESNNIWNGYIPKGVRVVYARFKDNLVDQYTNNGFYYYLDDESYIYDFFKYIKEVDDIEDEQDIIMYVNAFIEDRFARYFEPKQREAMHTLFCKDERLFYPPIHEHSYKDFYYNGSARCTEIAIMAQNLLSLLGFEVIYANDFNHAYNIYIPSERFAEDKEAYVLDFGNWVPCYNAKLEFLGKLPFFGKMSNFTPEVAETMFDGKRRFTFPNYLLMRINDQMIEMEFGNDRNYGVDYIPLEDKKVIASGVEKKGVDLILPGDKPSGKKLILTKDED